MLASRTAPLVAVALTAVLLGAAPVAAQSFDGYYSGRLMCDPIPGKIGPLNIAFNLTLTRGNATYRRAIYSPDGKMFLTNETGEGKLSSDGTIALSGRAEFSSWHYEASYGGKIVGNALELTGVQHWEFADASPYDRPCKATVAR